MQSMLARRSVQLLLTVLVVGLLVSFWFSQAWLELCAGLALFLFGMQCLNEGLRQLAGGRFEAMLAKHTATSGRALLLGVGATCVLQSTTLVALLAVAFISTGLIQLAGGVALIIGANLGTTLGIWLLAWAGQGFSLQPIALPLLVLGVLCGFAGGRIPAVGRLLLGLALILLGIAQIKGAFVHLDDQLNLHSLGAGGVWGYLLYAALGFGLTLLLQSSHATLLLALTALSTGQIDLLPAMAVSAGANLGSSATTTLMGWLAGQRSGQQLALVHLLFNGCSTLLGLLLLLPLARLTEWLAAGLGFAGNLPLQLACFYTLVAVLGVVFFWPWQKPLLRVLPRWLPEPAEPVVLITELEPGAEPLSHARYLDEAALASADAAAQAVAKELQHLARLSFEVICHALYLPIEQLRAETVDEAALARFNLHELDAEQLYRRYIKGVHGELLSFMGRLKVELDERHRDFWSNCHLAALQLVDAVKDAKHLQKNLARYLNNGTPVSKQAYLDLRRHLLKVLRELRQLGLSNAPDTQWKEQLNRLDEQTAQFDWAFRMRLFHEVREQLLNAMEVSSLMNDLGYVSKITQSLRNVLLLAEGDESQLLRGLRTLLGDEDPLIQIE